MQLTSVNLFANQSFAAKNNASAGNPQRHSGHVCFSGSCCNNNQVKFSGNNPKKEKLEKLEKLTKEFEFLKKALEEMMKIQQTIQDLAQTIPDLDAQVPADDPLLDKKKKS